MRKPRCFQLVDDPRPLTKPLGLDSVLKTCLEHHLKSDTNSQHRFASSEATVNNLISASIDEGFHNRLKSSDAGNHQTVRLESGGAVSRQSYRRTSMLESFYRRMNIAGTVIKDNDFFCHD